MPRLATAYAVIFFLLPSYVVFAQGNVKPVATTAELNSRTCLLQVEFLLMDTVTKAKYANDKGEKDYFKQYLYLLPVINDQAVVFDKLLKIPSTDSLTYYYKSNFNLIPVLSRVNFFTSQGQPLAVSKPADSTQSPEGKFYFYRYSNNGIKGFRSAEFINNSKITTVWLGMLNGEDIKTARLKFETANFKKENFLSAKYICTSNGSYRSGFSFDENFLIDSLPAVTGIIFNNILYPLKTPPLSVDVDCSVVKDTIDLKDNGSFKRFQYKCKIGYWKKGSVFIPAVFDRAEAFNPSRKSKQFRKVYAFIGNQRYMVKRNSKKYKPA